MALFFLIYMCVYVYVHICICVYVFICERCMCVQVETERQKEKEQQRLKDKEGTRGARRERLLPFSSKFLGVEDVPYESEVL